MFPGAGDTAAWQGVYPSIAAHFGMEMGTQAEDYSPGYLARWSKVTQIDLRRLTKNPVLLRISIEMAAFSIENRTETAAFQ